MFRKSFKEKAGNEYFSKNNGNKQEQMMKSKKIC